MVPIGATMARREMMQKMVGGSAANATRAPLGRLARHGGGAQSWKSSKLKG
jgi:hypothetical protein